MPNTHATAKHNRLEGIKVLSQLIDKEHREKNKNVINFQPKDDKLGNLDHQSKESIEERDSTPTNHNKISPSTTESTKRPKPETSPTNDQTPVYKKGKIDHNPQSPVNNNNQDIENPVKQGKMDKTETGTPMGATSETTQTSAPLGTEDISQVDIGEKTKYTDTMSSDNINSEDPVKNRNQDKT